MRLRLLALHLLLCLPAAAIASTAVHTTYLWHMHQPIYWPSESTWTPGRYETAYETITLGHSQSDVYAIFDSDDRVGDYQWYPRDAVASLLDLPEAGAQVSFAGALKENLFSLGDAGWNGGRYAPDWYASYRTARGWTNAAGNPRLEPLLVGFHHAIAPLIDDRAFRMELACAKAIYDDAWGDTDFSKGFFPAETCFSERLIPALVDAGLEWTIVADLHIARACEGYPFAANEDNCDPPNLADQVNPAQELYTSHYISRGVTLKIPHPFGFTPHRAEHVDPGTGEVSRITIVPAANAMGWDEGYGMFGTGPIDDIAGSNDPSRPMLILFAHDGDNAWSGGYSYYYESVPQFSHEASAAGYTPTTIATYLADHPVPEVDVVHVEDGGWVNADGDFGSPQFINWNWPLVDSTGAFDIPSGWAEDERNWAVLTAAQNRVETAEQILGPVDPEKVVDPLSGANPAEVAWHFLLAGYESGYMYYGAALDMEIKATLACNAAVERADPIIAGGPDETPPTIWLPQRFPWNPGGYGAGSLWGYPGGSGAPMDTTFHVWTFIHDVSGLARVELMIREDLDGRNDPGTHDNEIYAGGSDVGAWGAVPMNRRIFPKDEPWEIGEIDFPVLPTHIADQYWVEVTGCSDVLLDYYIEAEDSLGTVKRSPIQHVYVGTGSGGGGTDPPFVMDGTLDPGVPLLAAGDGLNLWGLISGGTLYLATEGTSATPGFDRFLLVLEQTGSPTGAPWAKTGTVLPWIFFLGAEESNGWSGWFDAGEAVVSGSAFASFNGQILEGTLDLEELYGEQGLPDTLWVASAGYETADGGSLTYQAPAGDGDPDVEAPEYIALAAAASEAEDRETRRPDPRLLLHPNPFGRDIVIELAIGRSMPVRIEIFDVRGRRVSRLLDGRAQAGSTYLKWDGRWEDGRRAASGLYLFRLETEDASKVVKGFLVR